MRRGLSKGQACLRQPWRSWSLVMLLVVMLVFSSLFTGCGPAAGASADRDETEDESALASVTASPPQKVAALMGSFAEIWQLAGGELAGVTDDAFSEKQLDLPAEVAVLGSFNLPNLEAIIELDPDLVLLSSETEAHEALRKPLAGVGIEARYFNVTYFQDYLAMLKTCTELTGRQDLYEQHGEQVRQQIEATVDRMAAHWAQASVSTEASAPASPRVLLLITYSGGLVVKGSDCMAGEMLADLGCINIADETPSLLKEMSLEAIIEQDPDYVFVIPMGNSDEMALKNLRESVENNPAWEGLSAVQEDRYILLPKERFLYKPNHLWGESYEYLAEILSPDENDHE